MSVSLLQQPINYLKGVGPNRADLLRSELGIHTFQDLLHLFPNRYIDRTRYYTINQIQANSADIQIIGQIESWELVAQKRGKRLVAKFRDDTGLMELVWFQGHKWIKENLKLHTDYVAFGKVTLYNGVFSMAHPELELLEDHQASLRSAMQPIYPSTEKLGAQGITNRVVMRLQEQLLIEVGQILKDSLPDYLRKELGLMEKREALFNIHFPKNPEMLSQASRRLKFEELFYIQLQLIGRKLERKQKIKGWCFEQVGDLVNVFYKEFLPFELTNAQKRVIKEIRKDMAGPAQMNRLLQGDVGSGKTIVALMCMLIALDNGHQACLMAPTEILATQHFTSLSALLKPMGLEVALLTGSTKKSERQQLLNQLQEGSLKIVVGTHAIIEETVQFKSLGLAIIDEQHKFGVAQRAKLWNKNSIPPHILVMTATPIPRTLAMSVYGDLDMSVIDELPPGRKPVITVHRTDSNRLAVIAFMRKQIAEGRQIYIVFPLIEESSKMDYKDLMDGYESVVREFPLPEYQVSVIHGRMKSEDKEFEMRRFVSGKTNIMVATTVIEVGVNVPNASVMVVESAERFGLSQLHQLRGRVGRGADQSYCILMTAAQISEDARTRMDTMVRSQDGFEIAEVDLRLRGPGDLMGTQQSGVLQLKIADLLKDQELLKVARYYAQKVLSEDPVLDKPDNRVIRETYNKLGPHKTIWKFIS